MKIYAATNPDWVRAFVGKNLWVHCIYQDCLYVYVRFIDEDPTTGEYMVNLVNGSDAIRGLDYGTYRSKVIDGNDLEPIYKDTASGQIDYVETICQNTKEYNGMLAYTDKVFTKFAGKPFWILCREVSSGVHIYVKILDKQDSVINLRVIYESYIDDYTYYNGDYKPSSAIYNGTAFVDNYIAEQPIDMLSDDEFNELLNTNDQIWEQSEDDEL